ncbi:MAG: hypothetical protein V1822_02245 [Candidatus Micrarchaeota archaeon]
MGFMNGVEIAEDMSQKKLPRELAPKAGNIVKDIFAKNFANGALLDGKDIPAYHKRLYEAVMECERAGIDASTAHAWLSVILDKYERGMWQDCSGNQKANLFVASNSSEINLNVIFGGGRKVEANVMYGNFGMSINARKREHVLNFNDLVPFSYLIRHGDIPAAIIFLSAGGKNECAHGACSSLEEAKEHECSPAGLAYLRLLKYVEDLRRSRHYADLEAYHAPMKDAETHKHYFHKIPLIAAFYDIGSRVVYKIGNSCKIDGTLEDYLVNSGLVKDGRLWEVVENLRAHEQDGAYTSLRGHSHEIKQTGCVDLRIRNIHLLLGLLKEIGGIFRKSERKRIMESQVCEYIIDTSHTYCGYLNTLVAVHRAGAEIKRMSGDSNPKLRKILEASLQKIEKGEVDVLFGEPEVMAAIHEFGENRLSQSTAKTLMELINGTHNDTRKTVRHAAFRESMEFIDGYPVFPGAREIEDIIGELNPGSELSETHFDLLVAEESARKNSGRFEEVRNGSKIIVTEAIVDLKTGGKLIVPERPPQNIYELMDTERSLFYEPGAKINLADAT